MAEANPKLRRHVFWRVLLALTMAAILGLSLMPPSPDMPTTGWDKSNHVLGFAVLAWIGMQAWPQRSGRLLVALLAYGALIELLQSLTTTRSAEWLDLLADGVGLACGYAVHAAMFRKQVEK